jgi:hypothetical protein
VELQNVSSASDGRSKALVDVGVSKRSVAKPSSFSWYVMCHPCTAVFLSYENLLYCSCIYTSSSFSSPTDADIVCLQEVSPVSFEDDFAFMAELGYDGKEMYKKGRFRPATFWKTSQCELAAPPVHKDRTLLTSFRLLHKSDAESAQARNWYVLNCHLQAGKQSKRRLRQINEGVRAVVTLAKKLKGAYHVRIVQYNCSSPRTWFSSS